MCAAPPRSATMVGSAVPTMVWSRAASSIPSMIVTKTMLRRRLSSTGGAAAASTGARSVVVTGRPSHRERVLACRKSPARSHRPHSGDLVAERRGEPEADVLALVATLDDARRAGLGGPRARARAGGRRGRLHGRYR